MSDTALPSGLHVCRRAVYLEPADVLVVADVHAGRDEASAVEFPLGERADLLDRLSTLLSRFDPAEVVVAGDLLHTFDRLSTRVAETVHALADSVADTGASFVVVRGNHDTILAAGDGPDLDVDHREFYRLADGETVVCHGHEPPTRSAARYVIGHEHPAIVIEGQKHPCALVGTGTYRGSDVVVLPAFNRLARGTVVNGLTGADALSPLLASGIGAYRPVVYDDDSDEPLVFPPMSDLRAHL